MELVNKHFATFSGMGRRFQKVGEFDGISIYDDYAHHPTEIKATLSSSKSFKTEMLSLYFSRTDTQDCKIFGMNLWVPSLM